MRDAELRPLALRGHPPARLQPSRQHEQPGASQCFENQGHRLLCWGKAPGRRGPCWGTQGPEATITPKPTVSSIYQLQTDARTVSKEHQGCCSSAGSSAGRQQTSCLAARRWVGAGTLAGNEPQLGQDWPQPALTGGRGKRVERSASKATLTEALVPCLDAMTASGSLSVEQTRVPDERTLRHNAAGHSCRPARPALTAPTSCQQRCSTTSWLRGEQRHSNQSSNWREREQNKMISGGWPSLYTLFSLFAGETEHHPDACDTVHDTAGAWPLEALPPDPGHERWKAYATQYGLGIRCEDSARPGRSRGEGEGAAALELTGVRRAAS